MTLTDLTPDERLVLLWLAAYMAHADGGVAPTELGRLQQLSEALEIHLYTALTDPRGAFADRSAAVAAASAMVRIEARALVRQTLADLSRADGVQDGAEADLLVELDRHWA